MHTPPKPSAENDFLAAHVEILSSSLSRYTGRNLIEPGLTGSEAARWLFSAPFAVVSHNTADDPVFNYGNCTALKLFEMDWEAFTSIPSRYSAEPLAQQERARLLAAANENGYFDNYQGIRLSHNKKRFLIKNATIWNLLDRSDIYYGQAAIFREWYYLDSSDRS